MILFDFIWFEFLQFGFSGKDHPEILQGIWDILTRIYQNGGLKLFQSYIGLVDQDTWIFILHDKFSQDSQALEQTALRDCIINMKSE